MSRERVCAAVDAVGRLIPHLPFAFYGRAAMMYYDHDGGRLPSHVSIVCPEGAAGILVGWARASGLRLATHFLQAFYVAAGRGGGVGCVRVLSSRRFAGLSRARRGPSATPVLALPCLARGAAARFVAAVTRGGGASDASRRVRRRQGRGRRRRALAAAAHGRRARPRAAPRSRPRPRLGLPGLPSALCPPPPGGPCAAAPTAGPGTPRDAAGAVDEVLAAAIPAGPPPRARPSLATAPSKASRGSQAREAPKCPGTAAGALRTGAHLEHSRTGQWVREAGDEGGGERGEGGRLGRCLTMAEPSGTGVGYFIPTRALPVASSSATSNQQH